MYRVERRTKSIVDYRSVLLWKFEKLMIYLNKSLNDQINVFAVSDT